MSKLFRYMKSLRPYAPEDVGAALGNTRELES